MPATLLGVGPWRGWPRLVAALLAVFPAPLIAQDPPAEVEAVVALRVGTAHPVATDPIQDAVLLLQGGRITAIGSADEVEIPADARLMHFPQAHAYPGLVDLRSTAFADQALLTDSSLGAGDRVGDGLNHFDEQARELLRYGVTTAYVSCRAISTWRGQGTLIRPRSDGFAIFDEQRLEPVQMWLSTGTAPSHPLRRQKQIEALGKEFERLEKYEEAFEKYDEALKEYEEKFAAYLKWYREHKDDDKGEAQPKPPAEQKPPAKPGGEDAAAQEGQGDKGNKQGRNKGNKGGKSEDADPNQAPQRPQYPSPPQRDPAQDALLEVRAGERALFVEVHRDDEIRRAIEIAGEYEIPRMVLEEATAAAGIADEIAAAGLPVVVTQVTPLQTSPYLPERLEGSCAAAALDQAGAAVAIGSGSPGRARHLSLIAAQAAGSGMSEDAALRAITLTPAEILGVQDQIGSLEVGKRADIILSTAPLLDSAARVTQVFVDGRSAWKEQR